MTCQPIMGGRVRLDDISLQSGGDSALLRTGGAVAAIGRIDNCAVLSEQLGEDLHRLSTSGIIALCFERWKEDIGRHLRGAWAFVAADKSSGRVVIGRDAMGTQPLYFKCQGAGVHFHSSLPHLIKALEEEGRTIGLDPAALARFAVGEKLDTRTVYEGVETAPAAQILMLRLREERIRRRYWDPGEFEPIKLSSDAEYEEAFLNVYELAVMRALGLGNGKCSLRKNVGITLSSGIDSASTAALAAPILSTQNKSLDAFTWVPERADVDRRQIWNRRPNEGPGVNAIAQQVGHINTHFTAGYPDGVVAPIRSMLAIYGQPDYGLASWVWYFGIFRAAALAGTKLLLSGEYGNFTVSATSNQVPREKIRNGGPVRSRIWRAKGIAVNEFIIRDRFVRRYLDKPADTSLLVKQRRSTYPLASIYSLMMTGRAAVSRQLAWGLGMDHVTPAIDCDVVDFCLSIPPELFARNWPTRSLIKSAFAGRLPDLTIDPLSRGMAASDLPWAVAGDADEIIGLLEDARHNSLCCEMIDLNQLERRMHSVFKDPQSVAWLDANFVCVGVMFIIFLCERTNTSDAKL